MKNAALLSVLALPLSLALGACNDPQTIYGQYGYGGNGGTGTVAAGTSSSSKTAASGGPATSGGVGGSSAVLGNLTMSLDTSTPQLELKDRVDLRVSIDPKGYTGQLTLSATDLSAQAISTTLGSTSVMLDGTTVVKVTYTLETASDATPGPTQFMVTGTAGGDMKAVSGTLTVTSAITIHIPAGVDAMAGVAGNPYKLAFGDYPTMIKAPANISAQNPVVVRFFNDDSVPHEIHAGQGAQGFPHDNGSINPMSMDATVRSVNAAGTYDYYLHDHGAADTVGRIVIQ
jgi:plastocyanin